MDSMRKEALNLNPHRKQGYELDNLLNAVQEFKISRSTTVHPDIEDARELLTSCELLRRQRTEEVRSRVFESAMDFERKKAETKKVIEDGEKEIYNLKSEISSGHKDITKLDASKFEQMVEAEQRKLRKILQENAIKTKMVKDLLKEEREVRKACRNKHYVNLKSKVENGKFRMQLFFTHIDPVQPDDQFLIEILWHLDDQYKMIFDGADAVSEIDESDFDELVKELVHSQDLATFIKDLRSKWTANLDTFRTPKSERKVQKSV